MATARSLQGINWLVRTYAPSLLTACNRAADAALLSGLQTINSLARLNTAITRIDILELQLKSEYGETWDIHWSEALEYVVGQVASDCPIPPDEMLADPDQLVKRAYKAGLRGLELVACKFLADGGVLV